MRLSVTSSFLLALILSDFTVSFFSQKNRSRRRFTGLRLFLFLRVFISIISFGPPLSRSKNLCFVCSHVVWPNQEICYSLIQCICYAIDCYCNNSDHNDRYKTL